MSDAKPDVYEVLRGHLKGLFVVFDMHQIETLPMIHDAIDAAEAERDELLARIAKLEAGRDKLLLRVCERELRIAERTQARLARAGESITEEGRLWMLEVISCDEVLGEDGLCECAREHFEQIAELKKELADLRCVGAQFDDD